MKAPVCFKDHVVEFPNRYTENDLGGGYIDHIVAPGEIIQQGTQLNASNLNDVDLGGIQGLLIGLVMSQYVNQLAQKVEELDVENIEVTLTNSMSYPFNDSEQTVNLSKNRQSTGYAVAVEVLEKAGGGVGDIVISDKQVGGFKIAFTGGASSVKVACRINGGV